jgi:predicted transcriptional regulator
MSNRVEEHPHPTLVGEASPTPRGTAREVPHPTTDQLDLATILRTCGDEVRLAMLRTLDERGEMRSGEVTEAVGVPASTCSYYLKQLRTAGVTRTRSIGTERFISLRRDDLDARFPGLLDVLLRG